MLISAWADQSQFLTSPIPAQPLSFNLSLDDHGYDDENIISRPDDSDSRLMEMLASQAARRDDESLIADEDSIICDKDITDDKKKPLVQKLFHMAASNGDVERVKKLLHGPAKVYIDVNASDEEGTAPIIYASCFVSFLKLYKIPKSALIRVPGPSRRSTSNTHGWRRC